MTTSDGIVEVKRSVTGLRYKRTPETFVPLITVRRKVDKIKIVFSQRTNAAGSLDELNSREEPALFSRLDIVYERNRELEDRSMDIIQIEV